MRELPRFASTPRADRLDEPAVLVELYDARVAVAVGHENVALRIPADVGLTVEGVGPVRAGVLAAAGHDGELLERIGPLAEHHQDFAVRVELGDDVRAFIDGPDVVVLVHAHRVREREAVAARAELLDEGARLIELEETRFAAPREDKNVAFRVRRDARAFAHVESGRKLEIIRDRLERNFGGSGFGFGRGATALRECGPGADQ